jgi:hypothetical protein
MPTKYRALCCVPTTDDHLAYLLPLIPIFHVVRLRFMKVKVCEWWAWYLLMTHKLHTHFHK